MKKGLFIAFEGIDGCGKSTQAWLLGKHLSELDKYNHIILTREPWKNQDIRKILRADEDPHSEAEKLARLFTEDRKQHVEILIKSMTRKTAHVISDRYSFSTLAYQQAQGMSLNKLLKMHKGLLIPDIIFIIDLSAKIALQRMKKDNVRKTEQKFEKDEKFIRKLRTTYLNLKNLKDHKVVIIDGSKKPEEVTKQIKEEFNNFYKKIVNLIK